MKKLLVCLSACVLFLTCNNNKTDDAKPADNATTEAGKEKTPPQAEFADPKYAEIGKKMLASMSAGDLDAWSAAYGENARYRWSAGDSLVGRDAIISYWKDRRANVIESIDFSNQVWLPIKVNTPQAGPDLPGVWLLAWYQVAVKYKNGKEVRFWTHTDHHFDANDKIDVSIQYIDRAPINAALAAK